jgi:hypothetical protein
MPEMTDVMVDIETFGLGAGNIILSAAFLEFHLEEGHARGDTLEIVFDLQDSMKQGFTIDPSTFMWWLDQPKDALIKNLKNPVHVDQALMDIRNWFGNRRVRVWANSPAMDLVLLKAYYREMDIPLPWTYDMECDCRTIAMLRPRIKNSTGYVGFKHTPADDAAHQIKYVRKIIQQLGGIDELAL